MLYVKRPLILLEPATFVAAYSSQHIMVQLCEVYVDNAPSPDHRRFIEVQQHSQSSKPTLPHTPHRAEPNGGEKDLGALTGGAEKRRKITPRN